VVKVGFFDSGVGGTCILRAFQALCPGVPTEYIADSAHCPYGNKPPEEIVRLSVANTEELLRRGCGIVVVACNTATAAAIDYLRTNYPETPFVGIEPATKPAALRSKTGVVGVLATAGTFHGRLYNETKAKFAKNVTVLAVVADEFVEIVEKWKGGKVEKWKGADDDIPMDAALRARTEKVVRAKVEPLLKAGADRIVLGCTHFPHLKPVIEKVCAGRAEVIDPSAAVARQIRCVLRGLS
jgi:glutamate racemase